MAKNSSQNGKPVDRKRRSSRAYVYVPRVGVTFLVVAVVGLCVLVTILAVHGHGLGKSKPADAGQTNGHGEAEGQPDYIKGPRSEGSPGPWGKLVYVPFVIGMPQELIDIDFDQVHLPKWYFKGYSWDLLTSLCRSLALAPEAVQALLETAQPDPDGGYILSPSRGVILALDAEDRGRLYAILAQDARNNDHVEPYRFQAEGADDWFETSDLSAETVAMIKRLLYRHGDTLMFADASVVLMSLPNDVDKVRLIHTLSNTRTVLVKLWVDESANLKELVDYYGRRGRAKDLEPLFESLSRVPGGCRLPMVHLLPPFARKRLYTYPLKDDYTGQNCYWTAMNFFNDQPDNRFSDLNFVAQYLEENYVPVTGAKRFGDVVFLMKSPTEAIHAAVYLADDIVFTKNGPGKSSPWTLMRTKDMLAFYSDNGSLHVRSYRLKGM